MMKSGYCRFPFVIFQGKICLDVLKEDVIVKKRFIAGAVCPKCKKMDTMALTKENNVEKVTCVSCGEQMTQPEAHIEKSVRASEQVIGIFNPE